MIRPSASALDLDSHSTLDSHSALDWHSYRIEHDHTALRTTFITRQEALDQHEVGLAARQERIERTDGRVREMQRAVGCREEAVGRHEEAVGRREKEVEEREKAVKRRKREV